MTLPAIDNSLYRVFPPKITVDGQELRVFVPCLTSSFTPNSTFPWYGRRTTFAHVMGAVCETMHVSRDDLRSKSQANDIAWPRQALMLWARALVRTDANPVSYPMIGRLLGGRDHATVMHGVVAARKRWREGASMGMRERCFVYEMNALAARFEGEADYV